MFKWRSGNGKRTKAYQGMRGKVAKIHPHNQCGVCSKPRRFRLKLLERLFGDEEHRHV